MVVRTGYRFVPLRSTFGLLRSENGRLQERFAKRGEAPKQKHLLTEN